MTNKEFNLMCAIMYEGLDNSQYHLTENVENTTEYCGIKEQMQLDGKWLLVWRKEDDNQFLVNCSGISNDKEPMHPDYVGHFEDREEVLLMYRLTTTDPDDRIRAVRAVNFFAWNQLNSNTYPEIAQKIHHTDCYNYKYAEIIFNKDCFSWGACLLHDLPRKQANELMDYCLEFYEGWAGL